jgi:hypothetical protein
MSELDLDLVSMPISSATSAALLTSARSPLRKWPWMRDFALVGGATGVLAPGMVLGFRGFVGYLIAAGVSGVLTGAVLGWATWRMLQGWLRRVPKLAWFPLGGAFGGLWGGIVGTIAGLGVSIGDVRNIHLEIALVSGAVAAVAGAVQLGWFWLAYSLFRVRRRSTWWVVTLACVLGPTLGWLALVLLPGTR